MKRNLHLTLPVFSLIFFFLQAINPLRAQVIEIVANPNSSANVVFGTQLYVANESIYTDAEIGATNFTTAATAINQVAFNVFTVGNNPLFSNVTIWMKEVPLATVAFSTGTYTTAGYTQVFNDSVLVATAGWTSIPLSTPFQRTPGTNLQVLVERRDGTPHSGYVYRSAGGNIDNSATNSSRRYNEGTPLSATTVLTASTFRPQIRLQHVYPNDALVRQVYTLGKLPVPFSTPHIVKANIANVGVNALTNISVTLNITGANTFSNVQLIPTLAPGASVDVTFASFTPAVQGTNNIEVLIPADDFAGNNSKSVPQIVNNNTFSYAYGPVPDGSAGISLTPFTGDFVAKFNTSVATALSQVSVYFIGSGQPFQIGIWDASGPGGTPNNLLFTSATQTSTAGIYVLPILPAVPVSAGDFFVGVCQIGAVNISFAYQTEDPVRPNTFYLAQPTGGTTWTDFAPLLRYRIMIEPKLQLPIDANLTNLVTPSAACTPGPVSYAAIISNVGLNTINAGAASVTLKIGGANTYTATATNTAAIASGTSATINFTGINLTNPGVNLDTVFVVLAGDTEQANDTLRVTNTSAPAVIITTFPAVENAEATLPVFPNFSPVTGSTQLWQVHSGNYTSANQTNPLSSNSGNRFFLFDSYGGPSSAGFVSRLSSTCIAIPANTGSNCNYKLRFFMSHDNSAARSQLDSLYVTVSADNGVTWTRLLPGYQRFDATYATPGWQKLEKDLTAYAGQTIQLGFEGVSQYGNSFGVDDITIASIAAQELILSPVTNNGIALTKLCDDQGWTYYSNPATPAAGLLAINWDPSNTGTNAAAKAAAVPTIQVDATYFAAEDIPVKKATYTMRRYWNVNAAGTTLTGPVNLRFFYDITEKAAIDTAASTFATANAGTLETGTWFKTINTNFVNNSASVNADSVVNAIALNNVNTGNIRINGVLYAQFDGITSFSGGTYATGVGISTPLPVSLISFGVKRLGKINEVNWSTQQEVNTREFVIERSADGRNYSAIGNKAAAGNSNSTITYSFTDNTPIRGTNYYRLRIIDKDNSSKYSATRSIRNTSPGDVAIYPNPSLELLNVDVTAEKAGKGELVVTDISGKIILTKNMNFAEGANLYPLNVSKLLKGAYFIKVQFNDDVVIRKFNKL